MIEMNFKNTVLFFAILTTALSAGLFYGWTISVIPGLKNIPHKSYLETMQAINRAILNPGFFVIFFGALILMLLSAFYQYKIKMDFTFWFIIGAIIFYITGTIGVTVFGNVPMNESLDLVNLMELNVEAIKDTRLTYETKWNQFHAIRTFFSIVAFVLLLLGLFIDGAET